ncbi:WD repeat-containing protein 43-like [Mizuhopecten yessoensis]|uniref:WD repeat-containing protein 43 n=1 Tax=Mizuhopecten yessoensis TaxID=6573 RepID=A0A210PZC1_MIZYE|nr:WD repeat-containing protein 43-like [Mizuhopecten yessoensis]OWF41846.1 WD repeat-containing protein 43 [Mizuhopecten yessoensis]
MELSMPFSVTQNGEYALYSSPDGVLKLWETDTGTLRQEYTPSTHLSATCTCLAWCPTGYRLEKQRKKKKRKSKGDAEELFEEKCKESENLVGIGTTAGNILLYNTRLGDIQTKLDGGHNDRVTGLSWQPDGNSLYSCSNDHHIVHWDVPNNSVKHKWRADKGSLHSVCVCSPHHLLSAGRTIKLWNTETHEMLKRFTGHATEVFRLIPVPFTLISNGDSVDSLYFLSGAVNDRIVNAWHVDTKSSDKTAVASFSLPDEPVMFDISRKARPDQSLLLTVVTKAGQVLIFEHKLNGKLKRPVRPKVTIQVATSGNNQEVPRPIPILGVHICEDKSNNILLVHGNFLKPTFEKLPYKNTVSDICLIREEKSRGSLKVEEPTVSKIRTPDLSKDMTVLVPELMAPSVPSIIPGKRRKRKSSASEMTIEARLNAIGMGTSKTDKVSKAPPKTDGLGRLLTQGLQSKDHKIINSVLNQNDLVIENTVKRMPVQSIIPLIQHLTTLMQGRAAGSHKLVKWIKSILVVHTSYLMTFPEVVEIFSSLYQMMDARTAAFSRLSKLQGKLDLILSQITTQEQHEDERLTGQQPLLMYQEESSDDEDEMVLEVNSQSDSDDNLDLFDLDEQETAGEECTKNLEEDMETDG